jgi:DNA polymerase III subunit delta'
MQFKEVVGQNEAKEGLIRMRRHNQLPHALLIHGPEGSGGLAMGLALATYILCEQPTETDSCGVCPNCRKAGKLEHADFHHSYPTIRYSDKQPNVSRFYFKEYQEFVRQTVYGTTYDWLQFIGAENKQGNITADECNEVSEKLYLKTYEGGAKILLMWRPEYLGKEGNKLLKLIEEPPANTYLIFVAENTEEILATIRSRAQSVKLVPLKPSDIALALRERLNTEEKAASLIASMAEGSYTKALALTHSTENDFFQDIRKLFNGLYLKDGLTLAALVDEWSKKGREQQKFVLLYLIHLLEHTLRHSAMPDRPILLPQQEADLVARLCQKKLSTESIAAMEEVISATINYIERNAHSKSQLMDMMIRLSHIIQGTRVPI